MLVITLKAGDWITLVASNRPPNPTSNTTTSQLVRTNFINASAVVISKNVAGIACFSHRLNTSNNNFYI